MAANRILSGLKHVAGKVKRVGKKKAKPATKATQVGMDAGQAQLPKREPAVVATHVQQNPAAANAPSKSKVKKVEKQFGSFLLQISDAEYEAASLYFQAHPDEVKIKKGTKLKTLNNKEVTLTHSMIGVANARGVVESYAMASGTYLGEGAYGRVKIAQKKDGRTFAVKIEGKGKAASEMAEETVSKWIGYMLGTATRKLAAKKAFKGKEVEDKTYSIYQLQKGKEIFEQLYTNVLTPGQLYTKEEQEQLRRKDDESLSETQRLLIAFKSCQVVQDLHNRGIIHGDLKPANLMADIEGHQIVVGAIDYGFSMKLDRDKIPPETVIVRDGAPEGTHPRYMPPEIRVGSKHSADYQPGQTTQFSTASDVFSLGVMFADDMQLPAELTNAMTSDDPKNRVSLYQVMDNLVNRLEALPAAERSPEIDKIIYEHRFGVRQMNRANGPAEQPTLIAQIMSGFRDPRESVGDASHESAYHSEDLQEMAISIYDVMKPAQFFDELTNAYNALATDEDKEIFIHNATIFVKALLKADTRNEYLALHQQKLSDFAKILPAAKQAEFSNMLNAAFIESQNIVPQVEAVNDGTQLDINAFIESGINNPALTKADQNAMIEALAHDLKEHDLKLFSKIGAMDFNNEKQQKDKLYNLPYNKVVEYNNYLSRKVVYDILHATSKEHQQKVYDFYMRVVKSSLDKGDYNTASAIYLALINSAVDRLKYLQTDPETAEIKKAVETLFKPDGSSKNLRMDMQKKQKEGVAIVPLASLVLNAILNVSEIPVISSTTQKVNGDKVQTSGHAVYANVMEIQQSAAKRPLEPAKSKLTEYMSVELDTLDQMNKLSQVLLERGENKEPDFSKVPTKAASEQKIRADLAKQLVLINDLKARIADTMAKLAIEHAKPDKDLKQLALLKGKLNELKEEEAVFLKYDKCSTLVIPEVKKINLDETAIRTNNEIIKTLLFSKIQDFHDGKLNENEIEALYDVANVSAITSDLSMSGNVLPFKRAVEEKRMIEFLQDDGVANQLRNILNQYARAIYASENNEASRNDPAVQGNLKQWKREIDEIVNKINRGLNSTDNNIKALATKLNADIKPMVDRYDELQTQLKKPAPATPAATSGKKSIKKVAKGIVNRVKAIRHASAKENTPEMPDTLALINRLHEETLKFTHKEAPLERKEAAPERKEALPVEPLASDIGIEFDDDDMPSQKPKERKVRFAIEDEDDDDDLRSAPSEEDEDDELRAEQSEEDSKLEADDLDEHKDEPVVAVVKRQPAADSPHMEAFKKLENFQEMLSDTNLAQRNQIKIDAMKMGVQFLLTLPKESKPRNFADIVKKAMVVNPSSSLDITTAAAAKTILAAIIPPNADLNQLTAQAGKMDGKLRKLKEIQPQTAQIKKKIALREDVLKYLKTLIAEKTPQLNAAMKAQVERAQPVISAKQNLKAEQRPLSTQSISVDDRAVHFQQCIEAFEKLIERVAEPENRKFFVDGATPSPVQLNSMLIELRNLNSKTATAEDIERIYSRGSKYWKQEGNEPLGDNPLIKLRDSLPKRQPGVRQAP